VFVFFVVSICSFIPKTSFQMLCLIKTGCACIFLCPNRTDRADALGATTRNDRTKTAAFKFGAHGRALQYFRVVDVTRKTRQS